MQKKLRTTGPCALHIRANTKRGTRLWPRFDVLPSGNAVPLPAHMPLSLSLSLSSLSVSFRVHMPSFFFLFSPFFSLFSPSLSRQLRALFSFSFPPLVEDERNAPRQLHPLDPKNHRYVTSGIILPSVSQQLLQIVIYTVSRRKEFTS